MKLFNQIQEPKPKLDDVICIMTENNSSGVESVNIDAQIAEFNNYVKAFNSLTVINKHIALNNYNFIDKSNYILYNEYIKSITSNLNMKYIPVLSQEIVNTLPTTALNHHIALEGFINDIWEKIKEIFHKIYNSIKEFFKKYFTRLGHLKNKLNNLQNVLKETNKDLVKTSLPKVPGSIASKFPFEGNLSSKVIFDILTTTTLLVNSLDEINKKAEEFISKDLVDKNLVANIKKMKEDIDKNNKQIQINEASKKDGFFGKAKFGADGRYNRNIDKENKSLAADIKDKTKKISDFRNQISNIVGSEINVDSEDDKKEEARLQFMAFIKTLEDVFSKVKNKNLVGGKVIINVTAEEDSGINIETDINKETPSSITLEDKATLSKMVKLAIDLITRAEKLTEVYGKINDRVMEALNSVDKLINDIDKISNYEEMGKYKNILINKVKVRLNMAKTFFNNYNKVCKNIFEMSMEICDGVVDYAVLSLKHFG